MNRQPFFTPAFQAYVAPAQAYPQLWRLVLGAVVIAVTYLGSAAALFGVAVAVQGIGAAADLAARVGAGASPAAVLGLLATFLGMAMGPVIAAI